MPARDLRWKPVRTWKEPYRGFTLVVDTDASGTKKGRVFWRHYNFTLYLNTTRSIRGFVRDDETKVMDELRSLVDEYYSLPRRFL